MLIFPQDMKRKFEDLISSGFGSGFSPIAPGTFGSIAYFLIFEVVRFLFNSQIYFINISLIILILIFGTYFCNLSLRESKNKDPSWIVIDEWLGLAIALQSSFFVLNLNYLVVDFIILLLFRFLDILKPYPINFIENLNGSLGVMLDDAFCGLLIFISVYLIFS